MNWQSTMQRINLLKLHPLIGLQKKIYIISDQEKEVKYKFYVSGYPSLILIAPSGLQYFFSGISY